MSGIESPPWEPVNIFLKWRGREYIDILSFGTPTRMVLPSEAVSS